MEVLDKMCKNPTIFVQKMCKDIIFNYIILFWFAIKMFGFLVCYFHCIG